MNVTFLEEVAAALYKRYGEQVSSFEVIFPSRRAGIFFAEALARVVDRPLWQPKSCSIDDLMSEISGLQSCDRLRLITELYKVYRKHHPHETFDTFYFWGDMLLNDFDAIDRYRIDAAQLYRNLSDLKKLEADISYLTKEQCEFIDSIWPNGSRDVDLSEVKRNFLRVWNSLGEIYTEYRETLTQAGIAYNGMIQRAAAERIEQGAYTFDASRRFVVAGFNTLSACEKVLLRALSAAEQCEIFWDYDDYYLCTKRPDGREEVVPHEAGHFIRENRALFPGSDAVTHHHMDEPKRLTVLSTVSHVTQCKAVRNLLIDMAEEAGVQLNKETAIVLTDENLLMPLLYAIPPEVGRVNVTMGYPLRQTLTYTFIDRLIELQAHRRKEGEEAVFYHADVTGLLLHPYVMIGDEASVRNVANTIVGGHRISVERSWLTSVLNEGLQARLKESDPSTAQRLQAQNTMLNRLFSAQNTWTELSDWLLEILTAAALLDDKTKIEDQDVRNRREFLTVAVEEITKLRNSLNRCEIELNIEVYTSLLRRHLQSVRVPFEGRPLNGIQVMGLLETRNLDFKRVIILSMNDDNFPGNRLGESSFIPTSLRVAFGLPTPDHYEGVYSYYFYRLIQRAEQVYMCYCSHADEHSTGEPSRYIYQLQYESGIPMKYEEYGVDVNLTSTTPITVEKDERAMSRLRTYLTNDPSDPKKNRLSPTALASYIACPLCFYFKYIAGLKPDDEELKDEIDSSLFGSIFHQAAENLYHQVLNVAHPGTLLKNCNVEQAVERAISDTCYNGTQTPVEKYPGNLLLVYQIVLRYLKNGVLNYDCQQNNFATMEVEHKVEYDFSFESVGAKLCLKMGGRVDRLDSMDDGRLRVVDYKTGLPHLEFPGIEALFGGDKRQEFGNVLQTLLYAMMLTNQRKKSVVPALYYVRHMHKDYSPYLVDKAQKEKTQSVVESYDAYAARFEALLREKLAELFDPSIPFTACEKPKSSDYFDKSPCRLCDFKKICRR